MIRYALLLAVLAGGVGWAVTAVRHPAPPPPPPTDHPLARAPLPRVDVAAARAALAAHKQRLVADIDGPIDPARAKAVELAVRGEALLAKLADHDADVTAVAADPTAVTPELRDATAALLAEAKAVRDEAKEADPEQSTFWDKVVDVLEFLLRLLTLVLLIFGSGGAGGGGSPAGGGAETGGVHTFAGPTGTGGAAVVNGKLMVSVPGQETPYRLTPPADLPEFAVRGATPAAGGATFPVQLTLVTPDGTARDFVWPAADAAPVLRHGK